MSNDDAVGTLREQVQRPGPITLVVAKCWDPIPRGRYFTIPRQEPVRPIDPRAWVLHTNAMTSVTVGNDPQLMLNGSPMTGPSSGGESSSTLSPSGAADLTPDMSMGILTSGQTSMPLGTSAAAYNMAALLAASQQQQRNRRDSHQPPMQQLPPSHSQLPHPNFYPILNMMLPQGYTQQVCGACSSCWRHSHHALLLSCHIGQNSSVLPFLSPHCVCSVHSLEMTFYAPPSKLVPMVI
ncbi:unnamed protein product [Dicrocoelium dendriticum]|nr:unnamed protein product [Dicrocoelium dendriticum]